MLVKVSSLTGGGCGLWKSNWATGGPLGLIEDDGKSVRPVAAGSAVSGWAERSNGLSSLLLGGVAVGGLEISNLMSELFSLLLLHDPSVSLFKLIDSVGSLLFNAIIYTYTQTHTTYIDKITKINISNSSLD